jgi:hypothetical protein
MNTTKTVTPNPIREPREIPAIAPVVKGFPFGASGDGDDDGVDAGDSAVVVDANEVLGGLVGVVESVVGLGSSEVVARADKADDAGRPRGVADGLSSPMGLVGVAWKVSTSVTRLGIAVGSGESPTVILLGAVRERSTSWGNCIPVVMAIEIAPGINPVLPTMGFSSSVRSCAAASTAAAINSVITEECILIGACMVHFSLTRLYLSVYVLQHAKRAAYYFPLSQRHNTKRAWSKIA